MNNLFFSYKKVKQLVIPTKLSCFSLYNKLSYFVISVKNAFRNILNL